MKSLSLRNTLHWIAIILFGLLLTLPPGARASEKVLKDSFVSRGKSRTVYLFVPDSVTSTQPVPLIVLLHGSGHNGLSLVDKWKDLASREGFIIAGPDSADPSVWSPTADGPDVLRDLVEQLKAKYPINQRRIYLFGHSGGAVYALTVSMLESEYFAATAVHAGAWRQTNEFKLIDVAERKIPIAIWVGTIDPFFPLKAVHATRDALQAQGFPIEVNEMPGHDHWYYDLAPKINENAWEFLKKHELASGQRYAAYGEQADTARANQMIQEIDALRKKAFELSRQAEESDARLLVANLSTERSEIIRIAQNAVDLFKQSSGLWLEAVNEADQARQLKLDDKNREYLSLIAQHNRKNAEIVNVRKEQAETFLGNTSADVIQAKRGETRKRLEKLQQEADDLQKQIKTLIQTK